MNLDNQIMSADYKQTWKVWETRTRHKISVFEILYRKWTECIIGLSSIRENVFWKIDESGITYGCSWTSPRSTGIEIQRHGNPFFVLSVELPHAVRELKFIDMHLLLSILWLNFPTQYGNWNVGDYIISADHHVELPHAVRELKCRRLYH